MAETGHFATLWKRLAERIGARRRVPARRLAPAAPTPAAIEAQLARRRGARDQGGVRRPQRDLDRRDDARSRRFAQRSTARAIRRCCMVDTISSLGSIDYRHDEWGVDVTVGGSQKGLMLPPGLSFNAISAKALAASKTREAAALVLGLGAR